MCALTFIVMLGFNNVAIDAVYGKPLHCVQGKFHYDRKHDALVFRREYRNGDKGEERVTIPLPNPNIQGKFSVFYCWGQSTAVVGNDEVTVILQWENRGLA